MSAPECRVVTAQVAAVSRRGTFNEPKHAQVRVGVGWWKVYMVGGKLEYIYFQVIEDWRLIWVLQSWQKLILTMATLRQTVIGNYFDSIGNGLVMW